VSQPALVCLPFAGAGASFYRPWSSDAYGCRLRVVPLQLPGRERRIDEQPYREVGAAVDELVAALPLALEGAQRVVLFGHSLGAVLAYELAARLTGGSGLAGGSGVQVVRLFVSGSPPPDAPRRQRATGLPDAEFLARVREFAGFSHAAMDDPEMREMILPTLRADIQMHEDYLPGTRDPLPVPVTALRGTGDRLVSAQEAMGWAKFTGRDFGYAELPGGHMYLVESSAPLLRLIERAVR
jgi:surfactin synthase thioesterase subunit